MIAEYVGQTFPCPNCDGELHLEWKMTITNEMPCIAGVTEKALATEMPWLICDTCDFKEMGKIDA